MHELDHALARLADDLGPHGEPVPLDGGITNRNFRVAFGDRDYVVRIAGKDTALLGIDRRAEGAAARLAADVGVGAEVAAQLEDPPCLVTRFVAGRPAEPADLREPRALAAVAALLRAVHDSGAQLPVAFSPFRNVEAYARTVTERGATLPAGHIDAAARARAVEAALRGPEHAPVPCHDDLLAANFILDGDEMRIVDWEYAGMGDRFFDLGNFAVNNELSEDQEAALLSAYFAELPDVRRLAALRLMRFMSDFREAMWGAVQSVASDLDFDFSGYTREHFERLRETAADPRFDSWLQEARGAHA